jgi:glucuronokinase
MVDVAPSVGCSAHFTGSGGAITGLYADGMQYQSLVDAMALVGCSVVRPIIFE